ncbi:MAG: uridine kinase [Anaerolineaceae bacterium]
MPQSARISSPYEFSVELFEKMKVISPAIGGLEIYEFQYCLENVIPKTGWQSIELENLSSIESKINDLNFYKSIEVSPKENSQIILEPRIFSLTQMLFVGLVSGEYPVDWVKKNFYFDVRGFIFLHKTEYFTPEVLEYFHGAPLIQFEPKQNRFALCQGVSYKEFKTANEQVDAYFIQAVEKLIRVKKTPLVLAIAGQTAAGKTEIVERLTTAITKTGKKVTSIELDNFLTDRDYREQMGFDSEGREAFHLDKLVEALRDITQGKKVFIPRYDFIAATSSHDLQGNLRPGQTPVEIEPADIIFIEGNFPFLIEEIIPLIGIKVVYITEDSVRLKRKWKRDMDYRKKYDLNYFRNRYFKDQFIMAQVAYIPQMKVCDLIVDTTGAAIWATPEVAGLLDVS